MKATRICSIEGCEKPYYARGYCRAHRAKALRSGELTPRVPATECSIEGCANKGAAVRALAEGLDALLAAALQPAPAPRPANSLSTAYHRRHVRNRRRRQR